jgi:hypothetical protein
VHNTTDSAICLEHVELPVGLIVDWLINGMGIAWRMPSRWLSSEVDAGMRTWPQLQA